MRHEPSPLATGLWPNEARGPENSTAPTDPSNSAPVEQLLKHVLVVDDDPALRTMVANYLVDQNVRVGTASDLSFRGDRALDQRRICAFDGTFAIAATSAEPGASARRQPRHDHEVFDRSIDIQILRLHRKIEVDAAAPELIKTERARVTFSRPRLRWFEAQAFSMALSVSLGHSPRPAWSCFCTTIATSARAAGTSAETSTRGGKLQTGVERSPIFRRARKLIRRVRVPCFLDEPFAHAA
jgi:hypothetical protein